MKAYLWSLGLGLLVGVIYALFQVRSPAPPVIALVGLLGILIGEQLPPLVAQTFGADRSTSWLRDCVKPHVFGRLPCREAPPTATSTSPLPAATRQSGRG